MADILRIAGRTTELADGLQVRRILPSANRRSVGPFIFFDHFGPAELGPSIDSDVGGHPHIGLATVSYLFEGSLMHRDSLGTVQAITPGAVNWMTAGRGIVHSERVTDEERGKARRLHGLQLWVALPPHLEDCDPAFQHVSAPEVPVHVDSTGTVVRVLAGSAFGLHSPLQPAFETLYLEVQMQPGAQWLLPALAAEMAIYSPEQALTLNAEAIAAREMALLPANAPALLQAGEQGLRLVVVGGAPLVQPVRMWWNFVSVDRERLADAARLWEAGAFDAIPGETERIAAPPWVG